MEHFAAVTIVVAEVGENLMNVFSYIQLQIQIYIF